MTKNKPAALMSYVHSDDKYKQLTTLRERLSDEVGMQIGIEFPIFQDTKDIHWGQNWEQRINSALTEEITFLIPIITPSFFNSQPCRDELERFLEVENKLKRNDLILPIYFVDTPLLNDPELRANDLLAEVIASRQYADWRDLRFEQFTNPLVGRTLAQLASQIRDALPRVQTLRKIANKASDIPKVQPAATTNVEVAEQPTEGPTTKTDPPIIIVDSLHRGDFATISEAINQVDPGTKILVRPGLYQEGLIINKPIEIIGDGEPGEIVIQATGTNVIRFQTTMGRVVNLTLRQTGGGAWYCVKIERGRLDLEDCEITSQSLACVAVHGGADPRVRRNRLHDSKQGSGLFVYDEGQGTFEDNDISDNTLSGVEIKNANVTLRRNRIHNNKQTGVYVNNGGAGRIEDNDIFGNGYNGMSTKSEDYVVVRNNRINKNTWYGVRIFENGGGIFENNDLTENTRGAWLIGNTKANVSRLNNKE